MQSNEKSISANIKVAVIDYQMSNIFSVKRACESVGMLTSITKEADVISKADAVVLPGVGAFGAAMDNLKKLDLIEPIRDFIASGKPFMGICLGMQLLMSESHEFGIHKGLNFISGAVVRFPSQDWKGKRYKIPQVGWNRITKPSCAQKDDIWERTPLRNMNNGEYMYFVHSYFVRPESPDNILATTLYSIKYASSVIKGNIWGFQFHPEKSGSQGIHIYSNFKELIENGRLM
ncbi:MAG: imidazole glycerol phosphate synthase subunit HisH [Smithellaceae bacterium]